jgi:exopolyphosphatase/guanosine-5'-triphosphate,3'-diphosphate pyrophosphatase
LRLAAIDIGSNSIKVVVVEAAASDSLDVLASGREIVRLGQETLVNKHISAAAMQRAVDCLRRFRSLAEAHDVGQIVVTATAFLREADNSAEFIRAVEAETGLRVEVLSGIEEARLIGLAASHGCTEKQATTLNIDIGGGSTEISLFRNATSLALYSVRLGAVRLTENYLKSDPPKPEELSSLRAEVDATFERPARELKGAEWQYMSGTSGTILALGLALRARNPSDTQIALARLSQLNLEIAAMDQHDRRAIAGFSSQRADIIVAGGCILEGAMRALGVNSLRTCDWALREGVIIDYLAERHSFM